MDANSVLLVIVGLVCGIGVGHLNAWRLARKLEHHGVVLADWDQPFDAQAPKAANLYQMERQRQ